MELATDGKLFQIEEMKFLCKPEETLALHQGM
jgi:hypothetical protein